ncbi:MAG TPA: DUF4147 domain-containing protein [Candidatus Kaiserbacteria bacterium]|nr:DUF4147 domain-containing protein [Candidatus Kaiserbacteria bacterium]
MTRMIKNTDALSQTQARKDALRIAEVAYKSIDTRSAISSAVSIKDDVLTVADKTYTLSSGKNVWVVGAGKSSITAAYALEEVLGDRIAGGVIIDVEDTGNYLPLKKIQTFIGTHPVPSEQNVESAKHLRDTLSSLGEDDLVIVLVSGGGSTLLCLPKSPVTVETEIAVFEELTDAGASIEEMNTVRKHLSLVRGGNIAETAYPARVIGIVFSDVPGNDIEFISSGPTVRDNTTVDDALAVIKKYNVRALDGLQLMETPKDDKYFARVRNELLVTNTRALQAMAREATSLGYIPKIVTDRFSGEAREVASQVLDELDNAEKGTVLLYGGESTVTLTPKAGKGGRSQEMALSALARIRDDELLMPFSSDGHDNTENAGALCDNITKAHASEHELMISEYLDAHRSYDFFTKLGDALITGYTGANVSDLIIALKNRA